MADFNLVGRIRPVYKGVWSIDNEYTVLETVINSVRHTAYIAIRDVPAGVELTNAEYWGILADVSDLHGVNGADGKDGGYIIPSVTATDDGYINFSFTPSDPDMDVIIMDKLIKLPEGPAGAPGAPGEQGEPGVGIESIDVFDSTVTGGANRVIINLTDGTAKSFNVQNGQDGPRGATGATGPAGIGIKSVTQTTTSSEDSGSNVITITKTDNTTSTFTVKNGSKGSKGDTGATGLQGEKGADGSPGPAGEAGIGIKSVTQTTTSSADGGSNVITVTKTDGSTSTFTVKNGSKGSKGDAGPQGSTGATGPQGPQGVKGDKGDTGPAGYTPVKGTDYFTDADQESIIQQVIAAIGTPVFGRVDAENNIILTGELAEGKYTLKYEYADGNVSEIGTLDIGGGVTNMIPLSIDADGTLYNGGQGWKTGYRLNSSGVETAKDGIEVIGFIPFVLGDVAYFKDITLKVGSSAAQVDSQYLVFYDAAFAKIGTTKFTDAMLSNHNTTYTADSDGNLTSFTLDYGIFNYMGVGNQSGNAKYFRISAEEINDNSIITLNEPIA